MSQSIELKIRLPKASWRLEELQIVDVELQGLALTESQSYFNPIISCHPPVAFGKGIFTLCHCMLGARVHSYRITSSLRRNFRLLDSVRTVRLWGYLRLDRTQWIATV